MNPDSYLSVFSSAIEITAPSGGAILAIVLAGLFLCVSAFVSASEIAYFSLTSEELQEFDEESPRDRLVKRLLAHPEHLLATILISNNLVNVAVVILCNFFFSDILHFNSEVLDFIFQTILLTFLLLLFGEVIPKFYANLKPVVWARKSCKGLSLLGKIFSPLANFLVRSTHIVNKRIVRKNTNISMNELSQALEMTNVGANDEKEMLEGIIKFGGKTVEEVMTPGSTSPILKCGQISNNSSTRLSKPDTPGSRSTIRPRTTLKESYTVKTYYPTLVKRHRSIGTN